MGDFRAFYCAAKVVVSRGDPYRYGPLAACEQPLMRSAQPERLRFPVVPAPLPGYALAIFVPLSLLPFGPACALWFAVLCAATAVAALYLHRMTGLPVVGVATALVPVNIGLAALVGQPGPVVVCALVLGAYFLRRGDARLAAFATSLTMLEPHVGIAACVTLFLYKQATRGVFILTGASAILLSLVAVGVGGNLEFFGAVLPAHAVANATENAQLSLTALLWFAGLSVADAVRYGNAMFVIMLCIGVVAAGRLAVQTTDTAYLVLVPPAFAMFGGVHVHLSQLIVAVLPLLFLAARRLESRPVLTVAISLVMLPWPIPFAPLLVSAPFIVSFFALAMRPNRFWFFAPLAVFGVSTGTVVLVASGHAPHFGHLVPQVYPAASLAQLAWGDYVSAVLSSKAWLVVWLRLPGLAGTALGLAVLTRYAYVGWRQPSARILTAVS